MRWSREEHRAKSIFYWVATAVLIAALVGMFMNFISWKDAIGLIKKQIPTQYGPHALYEGGGMNNLHYTPRWQGPLRGEVSLASDSDFNLRTFRILYNTNQWKENLSGHFEGTIKGFSGLDFFLEKKSNYLFYGEKDVKNRETIKHVQMWVYLLNKGEKTYKKVYKGQVVVDYSITKEIINKYKNQIDPDKTMKPEDIAWLCTFTHDSLHEYIVGFFERSEVMKLYSNPNHYAYRLNQIIVSQVKWKKVYEKVWTKWYKNAVIGIVYKIDNKTYLRTVKRGWFYSCHGGNITFSFWR